MIQVTDNCTNASPTKTVAWDIHVCVIYEVYPKVTEI
jgi:hypothetical protein